jgi:hypothetical protein
VCARIGRLWVWFAHLHSIEDVVAVERKALFEFLPYYPRGSAAQGFSGAVMETRGSGVVVVK